MRLFPREQVHVVFWERFREDPAKLSSDIARFLEIDPDAMNPPALNDEMPPLARETRERLRAFYAPFDRALAGLLDGSDLPWA